MNLVLRLFYVALAALGRPRLQPLDLSVVTFRVLPNDLDVNFHMNNGRYLTLMDLGRLDLLLRLGIVRELRRRRWNPMVASLTIRYRRSLAPMRKYELRTRLLGWDERWLFLEQRFTRGGELMAVAVVKALFVGPTGRVPPRELIEVTGLVIESPPIPEAVRRWEAAEEVMVAGLELESGDALHA
jgi:acyl-CoA thioesterase FadM